MLTTLEVPGAIEARVHRGLLGTDDGTDDREGVLAQANEVLAVIGGVSLSAAVRQETLASAHDCRVRTLDAIHLATAVVVTRQQRRRGNVVRFCTADLRPAAAAVALLGAGGVDIVPPRSPAG